MKKGIPDVIGIYKGRFIGVEVKIGADRQSDDQKLREQEIVKAGGLYYIAKDFDSFKIWFDGITKIS
jgi:Holliday junction resolvase